MEKKDLKPAGVFKYFEEICQVPLPSKKEEKMIAYLKAFGAKHNLETKVDEAGNVLIKKPATPGKENLQTQTICTTFPQSGPKQMNGIGSISTDLFQRIITA